MNIGKHGLDLIKASEGLRLNAYMPTPQDVPTIGYGHTKTAKMGMKITERGAEELLKQDLAWVEASIAKNVIVPLNQSQYDALCSFIYNLGSTNFRRSTLLDKLNSSDYEGAADEFLRWDKQGAKTLNGLTIRRKAERALFRTVPIASEQNFKVRPPRASYGPLMAILEAILSVIKSLTNKRSK